MKAFFKNNLINLLILVVSITTMYMVYKDIKLNSLLFHSVQNVNMEDQHFTAVIGAYNEYFKLNKNDKFAYYMMGKANYLSGEFETAIPYIEKCKSYTNQYPKIYRYLGNLHAELGELDEAAKEYEQGLELFPDNAVLLNNYAYVSFLNNGDSKKALDAVNRAIEIDPFAEAFHTRAEIKRSMGLYKDAIKDADNALTLKPDYFYCNCEKGYSLMKIGHRKEGIKNLKICKQQSMFAKDHKYDDIVKQYLK